MSETTPDIAQALKETNPDKRYAAFRQIAESLDVPLDAFQAAYDRQMAVNTARAARERGEDTPMVYGPPSDWAHDGSERHVDNSTGYRCLACRDSGTVRRDVPVSHPDFGKVLLCRCQTDDPQARRARWADRLARSCLPQNAVGKTLDSFCRVEGTAGALGEVQRWLDARERGGAPAWLVLWGRPGRGKSHLLMATAQIVMTTTAALWLDAVAFLEACKADDFAADHELTAQAAQAPVLFLDEFGSFREGDWARTKFEHILNRRYERSAPTAFGMTTDLAALAEWSPRIGSRLGDRSMCGHGFLAGSDYRERLGAA